MTFIPRYWYVELQSTGRAFELSPADVLGIGPEPITTLDEAILADADTGEIYGEAVLMGALPWPRFRRFSDGQQVNLPLRQAEALERIQRELLAPVVENTGSHTVYQRPELRRTCWVQVGAHEIHLAHFVSYLLLDLYRAKHDLGRTVWRTPVSGCAHAKLTSVFAARKGCAFTSATAVNAALNSAHFHSEAST